MRQSTALALAAAAAALSPAQAQAAGEAPSYSIAPLRTTLEPGAKVGQRRAGLLCGPAGALHWKDVRPERLELEKASAQAMHARGIDLFVPSEEWLDAEGPPTPFRLVPTVDALSVRLCVPHAGPLAWAGATNRIKASGRLLITWRSYDRASRRLIWTHRIAQEFTFDRVASGPKAAVTAAVAESADALARLMREDDGSGSGGR